MHAIAYYVISELNEGNAVNGYQSTILVQCNDNNLIAILGSHS